MRYWTLYFVNYFQIQNDRFKLTCIYEESFQVADGRREAAMRWWVVSHVIVRRWYNFSKLLRKLTASREEGCL